MIKIFNEIVADGLTPNGLYILLCIEKGIKTNHSVNLSAENRLLEIDGYIKDKKLTDAGRKILEKYNDRYKLDKKQRVVKKITGFTDVEKEYIKQYRELFPKGNLPSGYPARVHVRDLEQRFIWFKENYDYEWDIILKATEKYVNHYKSDNYKYMKTSGYFIFKNENGKIISQLANYCDMIIDGDDDKPSVTYSTHTVL